MSDIRTLDAAPLPDRIEDVAHLEGLLSMPTEGLVDDLAGLDGDLMILGVGGKVGPTLAMMAKRAAPSKRIFGVARFTDRAVRQRLEGAGVECITCDLLQREQVARLPHVENIVYMAGRKFGTAGSEPFTWAMNVVVPTHVGERFRDCRIVAFSTLCVYPFADLRGAGCDEQDPALPFGEYPNACVGRERVFQYFSAVNRCPGRLIRLNYAIDLRYGVLQDIALRVLRDQPVPLATPVANVIWQGDSTAQILRALCHCTLPSEPLNIGMPAPASVKHVANRFGELLGKRVGFAGIEQPTAWHNDCSQARGLFGDPIVDLDTMIRWNADWLQRGMPVYDKPTHYEQRQGTF
ncbi:MAG: NAD-dependent epimerase/dehydratase family protein [Planctomycetota bacterium]